MVVSDIAVLPLDPPRGERFSAAKVRRPAEGKPDAEASPVPGAPRARSAGASFKASSTAFSVNCARDAGSYGVMMMTCHSVEQMVAQAIEGGALGVLHKPFAAMQVLDLLSKIGERGRAHVADGDADFVKTVMPILEAAGYAVDVAVTGAEALDNMIDDEIDCLVLDLRLPVLAGPELYARLVKAGRAVPTVLTTGSPDEVEQESGLRSQIQGMLFKRFDPNALPAAVGSAVSRPAEVGDATER